VYEIETHVALSERLGFCTNEEAARMLERIENVVRPLNGLIATLDRELEPTRCPPPAAR
jgi:hypothetical protein